MGGRESEVVTRSVLLHCKQNYDLFIVPKKSCGVGQVAVTAGAESLAAVSYKPARRRLRAEGSFSPVPEAAGEPGSPLDD